MELFKRSTTSQRLHLTLKPGTNSSSPGDLTVSNGNSSSLQQRRRNGNELYEFDGTTPRLIGDGLAAGSASGYPQILGDSPHGVYYWAQPDGAQKPASTSTGTRKVICSPAQTTT